MTRFAFSGRGCALGATALSLVLALGTTAPASADVPIGVLGPGDKPVSNATVWVQAENGSAIKAAHEGDGVYVLPGAWSGSIDVWVEHASSLPTAVCTIPVPPAGVLAKLRIADGEIAEYPWPKSPGRPLLGPAPPNDLCANAIAVAVPSLTPGSTDGATLATDPNGTTCVTLLNTAGVWYSVTGNGVLFTADLCNGATTYDSKLAVFEDGCGTLTCVTGNDDDCGLQSAVSWLSDPGVEYLIFVSGFGGATGSFQLILNQFPPPANDLPCGAVPLTVGAPAAFDNEFATADPGEVSPGPGSGPSTCIAQDGWCGFETDVQNSIWYTFVAPPSGAVIVEAEPCDLQLAIWEVGNCADYGSYVELAANDDSNPAAVFAPLVDAFTCERLTPGATYYVQLDGFFGAVCTGTILVTDADPGRVPIDCNDNGIEDTCEVADGSANDCNMNGIPDDCEDRPACACATITIEILTDDFGSETGWSLVDQNTGNTIFEVPTGLPNATFLTWDVTVSALGCYDFTITDSFGDGICCTFGIGGYEVFYEGVSVATGGAFADSETVVVGDCGDTPDCNGNGIPDECDISSGISEDCNTNGVPDECDPDCNANGNPDDCETALEPTALQVDGAADDCADAPLVCTGIEYSGSTVGATPDGPLSNCNGVFFALDVWYRYRPRWSGPALFSTYGSTMPVSIEVWDGCPDDGGIPVDCAVAPDTSAKLVVQIKHEYWIRLAGVGFDTTEYLLNVVGPDCNLNAVDCNENMIPDECECLGDVNGDNVVSYVDLAFVTANLGVNGGPYDLDGSGTVNEHDQIFVLQQLGPCPVFTATWTGGERGGRGNTVPVSPIAQLAR